jgi:hypothetical protein
MQSLAPHCFATALRKNNPVFYHFRYPSWFKRNSNSIPYVWPSKENIFVVEYNSCWMKEETSHRKWDVIGRLQTMVHADKQLNVDPALFHSKDWVIENKIQTMLEQNHFLYKSWPPDNEKFAHPITIFFSVVVRHWHYCLYHCSLTKIK